MRSAAWVSALGLAAMVVSEAQALTIDNFEEGAFSVAAAAGSQSVSQIELATHNVIGGTRTVTVFADEFATATASLELTGGDDAAALSGDAGFVASVVFEYPLPSPVDLNDGNDRFSLVFQGTGFEFELTVFGGGGVSTRAIPITSGGTFSLQFDDFDPLMGQSAADFASIDRIVLVVNNPGGSTLYTSDFAAVPEPSTALLVGLGLVGIAAGWRRAT